MATDGSTPAHTQDGWIAGDTVFGNRWGRWAGLALCLAVGVWLRAQPLTETTPEQIVLGDSREYIAVAEFLMDPDQIPPGNRYVGYPMLLVPLFSMLPFSHEAISVGTSLTLSIVALFLLWKLASGILGTNRGLVVTGLASVHPDLVWNAHRALTEEAFLVSFLGLLLLFRWMLEDRTVPWQVYGYLALLGGWTAAIRPDAAYAIVPMCAVLAWKERRRAGGAGVLLVLPLLVLPFLVPKMCQVWVESLGMQSYSMRAGRAGLWMEFMMGRMPYPYMFNKETPMSEWILGNHDLAGLATIVVKSTVRNLFALSAGVGGMLALSVSVTGAIAYLREHRDWILPLTVPMAVLPQWAVVALWPEADLGRYNLRIIPLVLIFLVQGSSFIALKIRDRLDLSTRIMPLLPAGVLGLALIPAALPFSLSSYVRPHVDILMRERQEYLPKVAAIHSQLIRIWKDQEIPFEVSIQAVMALRDQHEAYAPTHYVLGAYYFQQNDKVRAAASLERALEIVPFFAEAVALLAEIYVYNGEMEKAAALLERSIALRPDYPLLALEYGQVKAFSGDHLGARDQYNEYLRLNTYQHARAFERDQRVKTRRGELDQLSALRDLNAGMTDIQRSLISPQLWRYLSLDMVGLGLAIPNDENVYYLLGACNMAHGDVDAAVDNLKSMTLQSPGRADVWARLGFLRASQKNSDEAIASWRKALEIDPEYHLATEAIERFTEGNLEFHLQRGLNPKITLPLTGQL